MDDGIQRGKGGVRLRVPQGDAAGDRHVLPVELFARLGQHGQGGGRPARLSHEGGHIPVQRQAVGVDLPGQRRGGRLDEHALQIVDAGRALKRLDAHVHGGDAVERHIHGALLNVLLADAHAWIKVVRGQHHGLAHADGVAELARKVVGIVAVNEVREHQMLHQARQGCAGKVPNGKK